MCEADLLHFQSAENPSVKNDRGLVLSHAICYTPQIKKILTCSRFHFSCGNAARMLRFLAAPHMAEHRMQTCPLLNARTRRA